MLCQFVPGSETWQETRTPENPRMPMQRPRLDEQPQPSAPRIWLGSTYQKLRSFYRAAMTRAAWPFWSVVLALLAGAALRLLFILRFPEFDSDSEVYGTIARNLLVHHAYALDNPFHPTLIRLPGYPVFLALIFKIFGMNNYAPVRPIQMVIDLGSCLLIAAFVRDHASRRAAHWALWLAALCPFTANYTSVPMTETDSIFCVALGLFAGGRLISRIGAHSRLPWGYILLTAAALSYAILLRPDGGLLSAAVVPGHLVVQAARPGVRLAACGARLLTACGPALRSLDHTQLPCLSRLSASGAPLCQRSRREPFPRLGALD